MCCRLFPRKDRSQLDQGDLTLNQRETGENLGENAKSDPRAALRAAVDVDQSATYVDSPPNSAVAYITEAWPHLPPHVRETLVVIVDAALSGRTLEGGE